MFANAKTKVARLGEVFLFQFVFFYFEAALEDFLGFGAADGDVYGDLFVAADAECADGVAGFACGGVGWLVSLGGLNVGGEEEEEKRCTVDGCLTAQLLEDFGCSSESVA